jgi:hypothetical protein
MPEVAPLVPLPLPSPTPRPYSQGFPYPCHSLSIVLGHPSFVAVVLVSSFLLSSFPSLYHCWPLPMFHVLVARVYPASIPASCSQQPRRSAPSSAWGTGGSWIAVSSHWVVSGGMIQVGSSHLAITSLDCYQFSLPSSSPPFLVSHPIWSGRSRTGGVMR